MSDFESERLLVIAPAYNESGAIGRVVRAIRADLPGAAVLVIDDGSKDNTRERARAAGAMVVSHPLNLGIGAAVQTGLKYACSEGFDLVARVDGDGQHRHEDIPALCAALRNANADAAFGSRFLPDGPWRAASTAGMTTLPLRRVGIVCFACLVTALTGQRATDPTSGFACYTRRAASVLSLWLPQDYPEVEGRIILHRAGLRVVETPTQMRPRSTGESSITSVRSLYYALKVTLSAVLAAVKVEGPVERPKPAVVAMSPADRLARR